MSGELVPPAPAPSSFPELVEWFDRFSLALVRLAPYTLREIREAVAAFDRGLATHLGPQLRGAPVAPGLSDRPRTREELLAREHAWFRTSLEQLRWFLGIVEQEDHGGHRQALGQYGRLLAEALRRHLADEPTAPAAPGSGKA